jgi:hypothetical protein
LAEQSGQEFDRSILHPSDAPRDFVMPGNKDERNDVVARFVLALELKPAQAGGRSLPPKETRNCLSFVVKQYF